MSMVVIGAAFVDIKGYPEDTFIPKGRNMGKLEHVHGGVARNIAENIANAGCEPLYIGLVDETGAGEDVIARLKKYHVDTGYMRRTKDGLGTWLAVFDEKGDVYASISKRPDLMPIVQILKEQGDEIFSQADCILTELDIEEEIMSEIMRLKEQYHKPLYSAVTNMTIAMERREELQKVDLFVCNEQEAGLLFDDDFTKKTPEEMEVILKEKVSQAGIKAMVVTLGEKGAVYADLEGNSGISLPEKVEVKDTTGAGDAFFSGLCIGISQGKNMDQACHMGSLMAASVIASFDNVCPVSMKEAFEAIL